MGRQGLLRIGGERRCWARLVVAGSGEAAEVRRVIAWSVKVWLGGIWRGRFFMAGRGRRV